MGRWVEARRENPSFRADIARDERAVHLRREFGMADIDAASDVASKDEKGPFDDVELPTDYRPSAEEPFMNERQLAYFRKKLIEWKDSLTKVRSKARRVGKEWVSTCRTMCEQQH